VLYLCERYDTDRAKLSDHICTGLQLANFWQDVARDLTLGRVYLPEEDLKRFGYSRSDLNERRFTPEFVELMRFQVDRARRYFHLGSHLPGLLPPAVRSDVELFIRGGLAILRKIEQIGYNVLATRPVLTHWEKAALLAGAVARRIHSSITM
jgi:phytoene/squalene synthetase